MKRKLILPISLVIMLGIVASCSENIKSFDDKNLIFKVVDSQTDNELISKVIEITNETGFDLENLTLKISYLLDTSNNESERDIVESFKNFRIKSNESKKISILIPIEENTKPLEVDLQGDVKISKDEEVTFEIAGALEALIEIP